MPQTRYYIIYGYAHNTGILEQVITLLEETFDISIELYII
jgi:hypothetical protein